MNNWYYNEMEMKNRQQMLIDAGRKYHRAQHTQKKSKSSLPGQFVALCERTLISAVRRLQDWYQRTLVDEVFRQISKAK